MPFRPNYRQQRTDRTRVKEARKQEKLLKRQENAARRKAEREPLAENEKPEGATEEIG